MEAVIAAVLHWLVDQTKPARERLYAVAAEDVHAFIEKHCNGELPPLVDPPVVDETAEPADPKDAEIARLKADLALAEEHLKAAE